MSSTSAPGSDGRTRPLGRTGLQVSTVCAGGGPLGSMPGLYGREVTEDEGVATVRALLASPIRTIEGLSGAAALAHVEARRDGTVNNITSAEWLRGLPEPGAATVPH